MNSMSEMIINEPSKNGFQDGFINGVTFLYVNIQQARDKYKSADKEYSAKLVVDEDTADLFKDKFPKNGVKEVKTANFEEQYGIVPPIPKAKKQYILTLKVADDKIIKVVDEATGEEQEKKVKLTYNDFKRPKVYVPDPSGVVDVVDITMSTNVGNGSKGDVAFWIAETNDFGSFPKLKALKVNELIPYEGNTGGNRTAFGTTGDSDAPVNNFAGQQQEEEPALEGEAPY